MLKVRNRLLVAVIFFTVALSIGLRVDAEARSFGSGSMSSRLLKKPGPGINAGEPDVGGQKDHPPVSNNSNDPGVVFPSPTGHRWIIATWAARYLGVGW